MKRSAFSLELTTLAIERNAAKPSHSKERNQGKRREAREKQNQDIGQEESKHAWGKREPERGTPPAPVFGDCCYQPEVEDPDNIGAFSRHKKEKIDVEIAHGNMAALSL